MSRKCKFHVVEKVDFPDASSPTVTNFSNPTVTGINNTFWDFKFVGLFYRTRSKLYKNSPTRN